MAQEPSPLLRIPAELRLLIYSHLFDDGGNHTLSVRNVSRFANMGKPLHPEQRRAKYHIMERSFQRICFATTYRLDTPDAVFHTAIMATNRRIYAETSHLLYGQHAFDFGSDLEAVAPFLDDLRPESRSQIREITLHKRPAHVYESGKYDWAKACGYIGRLASLEKLRVVVEGGRPKDDWEGPKRLLVSDLRLLWQVKHDVVDWLNDLAGAAKAAGEVEIIPSLGYLGPPKTTAMLLYAAFSASIDVELVDFLREDLDIPAYSGNRHERELDWSERMNCIPATP